MRPLMGLAMVAIAFTMIWGCGSDAVNEEELRAEVVEALDVFAAELVADRPRNAEEYAERLQAYLDANPSFFGSAAALLDRWGIVFASPYVYRSGDGYGRSDLAAPSYRIEEQEWLLGPLSTNAAVWTGPYFDEGGGDVWMVTRSVPLRNGDGIFAIVTTDLEVDEPGR